MTKDLDYFKELEVTHRKGGGLHPDRCPKLKLHGVEFAIPPRGITLAPSFGQDGSVTLNCDGVDEWPGIDELILQLESCISEGKLIIELEGKAQLIVDLMSLARKALCRQYDLTDDQVSELLSFDIHTAPPWIEALFRWAAGLSPEPSDEERFAAISKDANAILMAAPLPELPKRRWWKRG